MAEKISVLVPAHDVEDRIKGMAAEISERYAGEELHIIGILKGSVFFMCELAKYITVPVTLDFMSVSSYGSGTVSSGTIKLNKDLDDPIEGKNVIIAEDILDSGRTLKYLIELLKERKPKSLMTVTLLDKPDRREYEVELDMTGFEIPDKFVVGYGLDYDQKYRNLNFIGVLEFTED